VLAIVVVLSAMKLNKLMYITVVVVLQAVEGQRCRGSIGKESEVDNVD
jgi:hypothetical protein